MKSLQIACVVTTLSEARVVTDTKKKRPIRSFPRRKENRLGEKDRRQERLKKVSNN